MHNAPAQQVESRPLKLISDSKEHAMSLFLTSNSGLRTQLQAAWIETSSLSVGMITQNTSASSTRPEPLRMPGSDLPV